MISAFEVYLIMQATSIKVMLILVCIALLTGALILAVNEASRYSAIVDYTTAKKVTKWGGLFLILATIMPSTKTVAVMYVLPAITSKEVTEPLGAEAKELYSIAKKALIALGEKKEESKVTVK